MADFELQQLETRPAYLSDEQVRRARLAVADRFGHLVDDVPAGEAYDPVQVAAAAGEARPLLEALGLVSLGWNAGAS